MSETVEILCPVCSDPVPPKAKTGPRRKYCSTRCRQLANKPSRDDVERTNALARLRNEKIRANTVRTCPVCQETFTPVKSLAKKYCSDKCLRKATKYSKTRICSIGECENPVVARGLCHRHCAKEYRAEGRIQDQSWDHPRKQKNYQLRLKRLDGAKNGDPVMLRKIIARGDKTCPECGEEIDLSIEYPNPMYRTIDHKKPLAKGGKHTLSNCQLMHFKCNAEKGVRLSAKA